MQKPENKLKIKLSFSRLMRVLRLLKMHSSEEFPEASAKQTEIVPIVGTEELCYVDQKYINHAWLSVEYKKSEALMEWQKNSFTHIR